MLKAAGIDRAVSVLACFDSDAENIFTCLTARELRSDITIVARASVEDSEKKLLRAGADRVISPYKSSGAEMARLALQPQVTGVVDVAPEYRMEEIDVTEGAAGVGKTIGEVRGTTTIAALRSADGSVSPQPSPRHRPATGRRPGRDGDHRRPQEARAAIRAEPPENHHQCNGFLLQDLRGRAWLGPSHYRRTLASSPPRRRKRAEAPSPPSNRARLAPRGDAAAGGTASRATRRAGWRPRGSRSRPGGSRCRPAGSGSRRRMRRHSRSSRRRRGEAVPWRARPG